MVELLLAAHTNAAVEQFGTVRVSTYAVDLNTSTPPSKDVLTFTQWWTAHKYSIYGCNNVSHDMLTY